MKLIALIAARECTERLRSKTFLISNAVILGLIVLSVLAPLAFQGDDTTPVGHVGDDAAQVVELAVAQQSTFDVDLEVVAFGDRAAAEAALGSGDVDAVVADRSTVLVERSISPPLEALLASAASAVQVDATLAEAGLDAAARARLFTIDPVTVEVLDERAAAVDLFDPAVLVVYAAVFLLYGLLAMYGQWVAQGIVEEKQSRVVEVLLSAVRPTELLAGKVLGLGLLGFAQILLLVGVGGAGLVITEVIEIPAGGWSALGLVVAWYVLGYLLYACLFAIAGALVPRVEDLQSAVMPVILLLVLAIVGAQVAVARPTSTLATVAGLVPLTAPIVQPMLTAVGASSILETLLAIVLAIATIGVLVPLSGRIYGGAILRTRGRVSLREAWRSTRPAEAGAASQ